MGISIWCGKRPGLELSFSCGTFNELRDIISSLVSPEWNAYNVSIKENRSGPFRNDKTEEDLIRNGKVTQKIIDFIFMPDAEGEIDAEACRDLLAATESWDRRVWPQDFRTTCLIGYLKDFRDILQIAADADSSVEWT